MVSLRTNRWRLRQSAAAAAGVLILLGFGLTAAVVIGYVKHGASLADSAADPALKSYVASLRDGAPFDLEQANRTIYLTTTHSDDRRISVTENWLQWSLGKLYPPLARTQNAERLMAGSLTDCSERSQILKSIAESAGLRCRFVGLAGHVVLEVETGSGWRVADPDYGVVYPIGIESLQEPSAEPLIRDALVAAGHQEPQVAMYLEIVQSAEDNVVMPVGSPLSPRLAMAERWCERLALPLPLGLLLTGLVLARAVSFVRLRRGIWQWVGAVNQAACESGPQPRRA
ncbi:MAG TPA: hypothetical protein VMP01_04280 [Pirellulaceae bacterium]|nr:hypothetical protein [Pirellulaceae bacterium]